MILALLTRQLSGTCGEPFRWKKPFDAVGKQSEKTHVQNLVDVSTVPKVLEGHSLAQGLQQSGRFPELYIATIAAGERSGHLGLNFRSAGRLHRKSLCDAKENPRRDDLSIILMLMSFAIVMGTHDLCECLTLSKPLTKAKMPCHGLQLP